MVSKLRVLTVWISMVFLAACAHSYFKVADPGSSKIFYTDDIKRNGSAVEFKDAVTGGVVTLQNSAITQIDKQAYETAVATSKK
jgi:hypothetical protein